MKLSEEMREYLIRLAEHQPVTSPEINWPDAVAEIEDQLAECQEKYERLDAWAEKNRSVICGYKIGSESYWRDKP